MKIGSLFMISIDVILIYWLCPVCAWNPSNKITKWMSWFLFFGESEDPAAVKTYPFKAWIWGNSFRLPRCARRVFAALRDGESTGMQVSRWIEFKNIFPIIHELWSHSNLQRRHLKWLNASPTSVLFVQLKLQMSTRMTKHSSPGGVWFYTWIWRLSAGG